MKIRLFIVLFFILHVWFICVVPQSKAVYVSSIVVNLAYGGYVDYLVHKRHAGPADHDDAIYLGGFLVTTFATVYSAKWYADIARIVIGVGLIVIPLPQNENVEVSYLGNRINFTYKL